MADEDITIEELEAFFAATQLPQEMQLYPGVRITDVHSFVNSHLQTFQNNRDRVIFDVYRLRLVRLKELILEKENKGL